jgi:hypothetical protein
MKKKVLQGVLWLGRAESTETDIGSLFRFCSAGATGGLQAASALAVRSDRHRETIGVADRDLPV